MSDKTGVSVNANVADPFGVERPDVVLEVQRAVVLVHGFVRVILAVPLGWTWWQASRGAGGSALAGVVAAVLCGLVVGGIELYLSGQRGLRHRVATRLATAVYALIAASSIVVLVAAPGRWLAPPTALWLSFLTFGSTLGAAPELAIGLEAVLALSAAILPLAVGRKTLIAAAPAWLVPWLLSHGIRAVVGAAYYLVYDLGAEPLWRRLQARPHKQALALTLGGPVLAGMGGLIGWGLVWLAGKGVPPLLHPVLYLAAIDLVVLPLLPTAAATVLGLYRAVASRDQAWVFVVSPILVALALPAALVLSWLALHRWLARASLWVGRWQISATHRIACGVIGAVWFHLAAWIVVTVFNAQTGLMLIGREVPGAMAFKRNVRTPVKRLPVEMKERAATLLPELYQRVINEEDGRAFVDYALLSGESPDAAQARFYDLSRSTQRWLTGMPWYYSPAEFTPDRVERCVVLWGCLLLALMTMIRWPGLNAVLPHVAVRYGLLAVRAAVPTVQIAACLLGTSDRPDQIALIAGLALVGVAVLAVAYWLGWVVSRDVGATRHYAPFIATRLLQKRRIAFFAIGAVTLCVAMVLIVISVMGGFLDLVRDRSRGLLGDLIMENKSLLGFPGYQEYIDQIKQLRDENGRPIVHEATPVIYTYGVLRFPVSKVTNMVRVVGVRLDESVRVTRFGPSLNYERFYPGTTTLAKQQQAYWGLDANGLPVLPPALEQARAKWWAQLTRPEQRGRYEREPGQEYPGPQEFADYTTSDVMRVYDTLRTVQVEIQEIAEEAAAGNWLGPWQTQPGYGSDELLSPPRVEVASPGSGSASRSTATASAPGGEDDTGVPARPALADRLTKVATRMDDAAQFLPEWEETKSLRETFEKIVGEMMDVVDRLTAHDKGAVETLNAMLGRLAGPLETLMKVRTRPGYSGKLLYGVVIGRDLVARRQAHGDYERYYPRGAEMTVGVLPLSPTEGTFARQKPISLRLRYVDDSRTGVYDIDSVCVYVDFALLQDMMLMGPLELEGGGQTSPRASQILIKLAEGQDILARREQLVEEWERFCARWPRIRDEAPMRRVEVHTWEEQQAQFIAAVQKEKILVLTLFSVVSAVAIFLVLCIFYMIVTEKTRDIGILKSVGASAGGVAGVFLAYGAAIGVVGASLGLWIGTVFVHNINSIQNWIARIHPGLRIWSPEVYTFDIIPDTVKFEEAAVIFVVAIVSSVLGATFPALRAGRTWPVEALRYE